MKSLLSIRWIILGCILKKCYSTIPDMGALRFNTFYVIRECKPNFLYKVLYFFLVGFDTEGFDLAHFHGGESEALARLDRHLERKVSQHILLV